MKKGVFLVFVGALLLCGCQTPNSKSYLNGYRIAYSPNSLFNEETIAFEFKDALHRKANLRLGIKETDTYSENDKIIYLKVDDTLEEGQYSIEKAGKSFLFSSDSVSGINEACHDFLNKCRNSKDGLNEW